MKRDGFAVYTSLPRAALTFDLIINFFLEKAALHTAGLKVEKAFDSKVRIIRFSRLVWQHNKLER